MKTDYVKKEDISLRGGSLHEPDDLILVALLSDRGYGATRHDGGGFRTRLSPVRPKKVDP